jgi:FkbM family methyltransferase
VLGESPGALRPYTLIFRMAFGRTRRLIRKVQDASIDRVVAPLRVECPQVRHGSSYGGWVVNPELIRADSVVYSFGLGEDVTFDLALIETYGVEVHGFEPDPRTLEWLGAQTLPPSFHVHAFALADHDGRASLFPQRPSAPDGTPLASRTLLSDFRPDAPEREIENVAVHRLRTVMSMLGHERVDVLKMDIEGAEYTVIDDLLASAVPVGQLLVEFHHRLRTLSTAQTRRAIRKLAAHGFRPFAVSSRRTEFSLLGEADRVGA